MAFKSLYPAPGLYPTYSDAFLSQSSEFPWGILLTESLGHPGPKRAEQFLAQAAVEPKPSALLRLPADGPRQRGSSLRPPQDTSCLLQTCQRGQENKAHCPQQFCFPGFWFVQSPKQEPQNLSCRDVSSPAVLLPVWAVVPALSRGYGGHKTYQVIWSYDNRTLQRWGASDSTVPHRGHLHAVTLTLTLINFIFQLTAQAGKSNGFIQFTIKQRSKPVHREQALLDINSIWRSKRGVFNFAYYFHFLIFTGFCSSCYQTAQKAELIGKTLSSAAGAENVISQTDGILWWLPAQFLWASDEEFSHENVMNFHKVPVRALWDLSFIGKFTWFSQQGQWAAR